MENTTQTTTTAPVATQEYHNPTPVAVMLIPVRTLDGELRLLGVVRGIMPKKGEIALPGGFVDEMESIEVAAQREAKEETGLVIAESDIKLYCSKITPRNQVLVFCRATNEYTQDIMNELVLNSEVEGFVLIDRNTPMAFPLHKQAVEQFFDEMEPENIATNNRKAKM
jgi:ADP-ribose pyrophosphatase YjhB (NUDIX family)